MRNYIVLNGQSSNEITGLLIQSLPAITKPKIRTQVEEIDGRDGDIITKLGYSAYDKEISIGLYGNYDVDDVIAYFTDNQSGKVTFSDEPDKYYYYEILDQVDFERLIRYRTATVTLHCQPFKYSISEEKIQIDATEVSGSGSNITLNNTEDGALFTSLKINGDTSQDGTPTPSSPVDVNVATGEITINVCNKNLLNLPNKTTTSNGITMITENNVITLNNTATANSFINAYNSTNALYLEAGTYTLSANNSENAGGSSGQNAIRLMKPNGSDVITGSVCTMNTTNATTTFTISEATYCFLSIRTQSGTSYTNFKIYPMLEKSSTATTFEPYVSQTYSIDLGDIELCKIGDYQDYIYKENGNWYLYKAIGKVVLDGNETINSLSNSRYQIPLQISAGDGYNTSISKCNLFKTIGQFEIASTTQENVMAVNGGFVYIRVTSSTTLQEVKTLLSNTNAIVYYVLATPTTTQITDETLISQLEALASATTYLGQTNIITSGSDLNPLLDVTTYAVDDPSFVITNSGNFKSKPIITIYGLGTIGLYLNGIQVLSLDMGETTSQITIDVAKLEAYNQETGALMNRNVTGDYNNLSLNVGENTITESGTLQGLEVENYSRWL